MSGNGSNHEHASVTLNGDLRLEKIQATEPRPPASPRTGDEQALESHEVIELQAFIERKAWIEEKIKILEKMPPIEVFAGLDAVRDSAREVPGLPTRPELQQWLIDHDVIEKETEVFDSGEMRKLKKFTKAAAQRNLSPEDTDLIELTLTTIFDLDRLLHLLRDRSEHLDLLEVRLTWEECRMSAWSEVHKILEDAGSFLNTRARWTSTVYESLNSLEEQSFTPVIRRGSVASLSSAASVNSESSINSTGFSRGARFKLSEQLSREAIYISGKISSLKHGKIAAAGKALDKLIDASRRPIPDELLDEQDRLEEKGANELEQLGQFIMSVVGQWRKADEIYVDTMKDKTSLLNLIEEVETSKLRRPNVAQSLSFTTRLDKLKRRLGLRDAPDSPRSTFPRPSHPSFTDQISFNESLVQTLSKEIKSVSELFQAADVMVQGYAASANIVQQAEVLAQGIEECTSSLTSIIDQLVVGVPVSNGDGSPPSLSSETSLLPASHSAFFAMLPTLLDSLDQTSRRANQRLTDWALVSLQLEQHGIDPPLRISIASQVKNLSELQDRGWAVAHATRDLSEKLQITKDVCSCMDVVSCEIDALHRQILREIEHHRWRKGNQYSALLTPPTPSASLAPSSSFPCDPTMAIQQLRSRYSTDIEAPLGTLSSSFGSSLATWVNCKSQHVRKSLVTISQTADILEAVKNQKLAMQGVRDDFDALMLQIEDLSAQQAARVQDILKGASTEDIRCGDSSLENDIDSVKLMVQAFSDGLSNRVPFVSPSTPPTFSELPVDPATGTIAQTSLGVFDVDALDALVRADCNSYVMRAGGEMEALHKAIVHVKLARMAKCVDAALAGTSDVLNAAVHRLNVIKESLPFSDSGDDTLTSLHAALEQVDDLTGDQSMSISRSFSPIQDILRQMDAMPATHDPAVYKTIYLSRRRAVDDVELRFTSWKEGLETLRQTLLHTKSVETKRIQMVQLEQERLEKELQEQQRVAEENRRQVEETQALAKAANMERLRREREEAEEKLKLEEARQTLRLERERFAADSAENRRLEKEHRATIEKLLAEEARLREDHAKQVAEGRLAVEQAEKYRQEHERQASEKIKKIEEELHSEEARLRMEKERIAEEISRLHREQAETQTKSSQQPVDHEDVFGPTALAGKPSSSDAYQLQLTVGGLRKRLRALSLNKVAHPSSTSAPLPSSGQAAKLDKEFSTIRREADLLPRSVDNPSVDLELKSLFVDIDVTSELMAKIQQLASLTGLVLNCDAALSDLLEHVDSYPSLPLGFLSSDYRSPTHLPPEAQLESRLTFTRTLMNDLDHLATSLSSDARVSAEQQRVVQTWKELEDMAKDRLRGRKSRPSSVISVAPGGSGRSSRASTAASIVSPTTSSLAKKKSSYAGLSAGPPSAKSRFLSPSVSGSRRAVSGGSTDAHSRSTSRLSSVSTSRSVSGPQSSLYTPTFASRQRTSSLSTSASTTTTPNIRSTQRARAQTNQATRTASPAMSDARSVRPSRSSLAGTWSRAPRLSLGQPTTPQPKALSTGPRKAYVPDPKSKLDIAVGDVVNNLPVNINVEGVAETWRDQSGKYWIGDQDPKLCFCRILRSHTVMVRVGGGWSELSKFIRDHFAESFRLMPDSPSRPGASAGPEKWISSTSLLEAAAEISETPPVPPRTPEPKFPFVPTFALSTPSARSPHSVRSSPSTKGSPLTPMQFIRRADPDAPLLRPTTPSKSTRAKRSMPPTPARHAIWRP